MGVEGLAAGGQVRAGLCGSFSGEVRPACVMCRMPGYH